MKRLIFLLLAIAATVHAARPNVLLIVTDDQRPDTVGNSEAVRTPNLDRLIARGTRFTRAIAAYPICHVSRAEILTGCTAFKALVKYPEAGINPKLATWARTFHEAGYQTWFTGKWHNDGQPRTRGYDETRALFTAGGAAGRKGTMEADSHGRAITGYTGWTFKTNDGKPEPEKGVGLTPGISERFADAAIEFIQRPHEQPFFLQVCFTAPHDPRLNPIGHEHDYDPQKVALPRNFAPRHPFDHGNIDGRDELLLPRPLDPMQVKEELATYYAIITHLDAQIGRIFASLESANLTANTLIMFTSDQGLALGSHGLLGKQNEYEHTSGVPLIMAGPGVPEHETRDTQCYLRDLFPTACELAGIAIPATVEGRSLAPALKERAHKVYPFVVGYFTDTQRMIHAGQWKLIEYPQVKRRQLFDLKADPDELDDRAGDPAQASRMDDLSKDLHRWLRAHGDL